MKLLRELAIWLIAILFVSLLTAAIDLPSELERRRQLRAIRAETEAQTALLMQMRDAVDALTIQLDHDEQDHADDVFSLQTPAAGTNHIADYPREVWVCESDGDIVDAKDIEDGRHVVERDADGHVVTLCGWVHPIMTCAGVQADRVGVIGGDCK